MGLILCTLPSIEFGGAMQAFGKGLGPFIANVTEPDFLQAVSHTLAHTHYYTEAIA